jgi:hypothetical protein
MNSSSHPKRFQAAPKLPLLVLAAAIVGVGLLAAGWFWRSQQPQPLHPETALFRELDESRVLFLELFRSQEREATIATLLDSAGLSMTRTVRERPQDVRYPPRRITSFQVADYKHLDCEGWLELTFFNDRLMEAEFRPRDAARYAPRLKRAYPGLRSIGTGHAEYVAPPLRIWSSVELARSKVGRSLGSEGKVLWQDLRMTRQLDDWDARFGHIPIPSKR